jgi:hypothetical protein
MAARRSSITAIQPPAATAARPAVTPSGRKVTVCR